MQGPRAAACKLPGATGKAERDGRGRLWRRQAAGRHPAPKHVCCLQEPRLHQACAIIESPGCTQA